MCANFQIGTHISINIYNYNAILYKVWETVKWYGEILYQLWNPIISTLYKSTYPIISQNKRIV